MMELHDRREWLGRIALSTGAVLAGLGGDAYAKLLWYTTSFFPLFYAAMGKPFSEEASRKLARHMERNQAEDS
jgi:hypothetical protein